MEEQMTAAASGSDGKGLSWEQDGRCLCLTVGRLELLVDPVRHAADLYLPTHHEARLPKVEGEELQAAAREWAVQVLRGALAALAGEVSS